MEPAERLVQYQVVAARRTNYEAMMWQVPTLALTAQAFLMTIGLAPSTGRLARIAVGLLSLAISIMAVQLTVRHRLNEITDSMWLEEFELTQNWKSVHGAAQARAEALGFTYRGIFKLKSYRVWIAGLSGFGLVGLAIAVWALFA